MNRSDVQLSLSSISAWDYNTLFTVESERLYVRCPRGLTDEQRGLIAEHKADILAYLTTPPALAGQCIRGHEIEWKVSPYGVWLCSCYYLPAPAKSEQDTKAQPAAANNRKPLQSYWIEDTQRSS